MHTWGEQEGDDEEKRKEEKNENPFNVGKWGKYASLFLQSAAGENSWMTGETCVIFITIFQIKVCSSISNMSVS